MFLGAAPSIPLHPMLYTIDTLVASLHGNEKYNSHDTIVSSMVNVCTLLDIRESLSALPYHMYEDNPKITMEDSACNFLSKTNEVPFDPSVRLYIIRGMYHISTGFRINRNRVTTSIRNMPADILLEVQT